MPVDRLNPRCLARGYVGKRETDKSPLVLSNCGEHEGVLLIYVILMVCKTKWPNQ